MPAKYCSLSSCGGKTTYEIKAPLFCSHCGAEYAKAFAAAPTQPIETQPVRQAARPAPPISSRNVANYRRPAPLRGVPAREGDDQDDEPYDPYAVRAARERGREIGASISAADFGLTVRAVSDVVTLGALFEDPSRHMIGQRTADLAAPTYDTPPAGSPAE